MKPNRTQQHTFWKSFKNLYWEKKPLLVRDFVSSVREIDDKQVFSMLVEYSDQCRKFNSADGFKFYIEGQQIHSDEILELLPVKQDQSLLNYHKRMDEAFSDYCLVCDELLQVSQTNFQRLRVFTENLFTQVGFPNRFVEIGLYLGNYRKTPFGVHVDGCGVFSFPVVGKKVFRLWKPAFAKRHPELDRSHKYSKFNGQSQILTAGPGDMTYWPSSVWHIAESDGGFSATWSLGVWVDRTHQENLEEAIKPLLKEKLRAVGLKTSTRRQPIALDGEVLRLPSAYSDSISALQKISANELYDAFLKSWLQLSSREGFKNIPPTRNKIKISIRSEIQLSDLQKISWARLKKSRHCIYAFRGILLDKSHSQQFLKLIRKLNTGSKCLVSDYLTTSSRTSDLKALQAIADLGAFQ